MVIAVTATRSLRITTGLDGDDIPRRSLASALGAASRPSRNIRSARR